MEVTKVIIDTNVFIKAIFHGDKWSRELIKLHIDGKIKLAMNDECLTELFVVFSGIAEKFRVNIQKIYKVYGQLINALWNYEQVSHITCSNFCSHAPDNKFVDCAIDSKADFIITYNTEHFLECERKIKENYNLIIKVKSPYQFIIDNGIAKLKEYYDVR